MPEASIAAPLIAAVLAGGPEQQADVDEHRPEPDEHRDDQRSFHVVGVFPSTPVIKRGFRLAVISSSAPRALARFR